MMSTLSFREGLYHTGSGCKHFHTSTSIISVQVYIAEIPKRVQ